ncbi:MAG: hypothetical protein IPI12_11240 [Ignavibacteriales bacterium]|nr:hypothetical protein [Ignavibacteriales bacterium]
MDKEKIGVIGHSEGGVIAPIVAVKNPNTRFIINLAGTGVSGRDIIIEQSELLAKADSSFNKANLKNYIDLMTRIIEGILQNLILLQNRLIQYSPTSWHRLLPKIKKA